MLRTLAASALLLSCFGCAAKPGGSEAEDASEAEPSGEIEPDVVDSVVHGNFQHFRLCYEDGLYDNPQLAGRVSVRFIVQIDGSVVEVSVADTDFPPTVTDCIAHGFYKLRFPAQESDAQVVYPIYFSAS